MNMQQIVDDPALWGEFVKAYRIAGQYRPRVQFRKDMICLKENYIVSAFIFNIPTKTFLIDARKNYVNPDLGG